MTKIDHTDHKSSLRQRAERRFSKEMAKSHEGDKNKLLHELYVHQIELEMQNNELNEARRTQNEALKRYTDLFEFAPIAYFVLNANAEIIEANLTATTLFNILRSNLVGTKLINYIMQPHKDRLTKALEDAFIYRKKSSFELQLTLSSDPSHLWVNVEIKLDNSSSLCMIAMNDITLHKEADVKMLLISAVYTSLYESVMVVDKYDRITTVNPSFTTLTGYSESEVLGQSPVILKSDKYADEFYLQLLKQLKQTNKWEGEIYARHKNGEDIILALSITSIYDPVHLMSHQVATFKDIGEKKRASEMIIKQANFDLLTDLPNRRLFQDRLEQGIKMAVRNNRKLALLTFDIDNFKSINDSLGHQLGDELLIQAAVRIGDCIRESDTVARLGGDEFAIIMSQVNEAVDIDHLCHRLLQTMTEPFILGDSMGYVSVSIGITIFPDDGHDIESLIRNADNAMYVAKQEGRNRLHYFTPQMQEKINRKLYLSNELRDVLVNNQLSMVYQPIIHLETGLIFKAEALVRWHHPILGDISPAEFIPIAEENGLIVEIGDWIFKHVSQQTLAWCNSSYPNFKININKSPIQFNQSLNQLSWASYLAKIGLKGHAIVVEITEGLLMNSGEHISQQLTELNATGIEVAIDDFGTGFSSLTYLKKFHVDYLKIDQSFIQNLEHESDDMALCEAIIVMAHKLGIKVIAEGIETQEQYTLLLGMGCDYGQGYLFSIPVPANEFELMLSKS